MKAWLRSNGQLVRAAFSASESKAHQILRRAVYESMTARNAKRWYTHSGYSDSPGSNGTMHLTIVNGGHGEDQGRISNPNRSFGRNSNGRSDNPNHTSFDTYLGVPKRASLDDIAYPRIEDFLADLDIKCTDRPRNLSKYTSYLTGDEYLGYYRIHDIVIDYGSITNPTLSGGEWIKARIEHITQSNYSGYQVCRYLCFLMWITIVT